MPLSHEERSEVSRLTARIRWANTPPKKRRRLGLALARMGNAAYALKSPEERSAQGRHAVSVRWANAGKRVKTDRDLKREARAKQKRIRQRITKIQQHITKLQKQLAKLTVTVAAAGKKQGTPKHAVNVR